ncbi:hypothetical protein N7528_005763 [Penicillium herquei]|nr:hypothetical protein N7528_005763 [Penicillium herquei]
MTRRRLPWSGYSMDSFGEAFALSPRGSPKPRQEGGDPRAWSEEPMQVVEEMLLVPLLQLTDMADVEGGIIVFLEELKGGIGILKFLKASWIILQFDETDNDEEDGESLG